ncbi:MAG: hypothetical protein KKI08_23975 [Armatimonadetes bacterium]|nr:hypothetical protein [Armatimonadota bacterium]
MSAERLEQYRQAGLRAAQFTLGFQQPDGGYIWDGFPPDAFHKQAYSWGVGGHALEANRLLDWVQRERLLPDGQLRDYHGDMYKHAWLLQGAQRLGRFDVTYLMADFIASCQAPCGGFPHMAGGDTCRALAGCQVGIAMLYMGRMDVAEQAAAWTISLLDQPHDDRFGFCTTLEGELLAGEGQAIVLQQPQQVYWELGLPLMLMCRMTMATGEGSYLDHARAFFDWHLRCAEDRFTFTGSGKSGLGAALLYLLTGDTRARDAAVEFGDRLLATQADDGVWHSPSWPEGQVLYLIDAGVEFNVWLQEIAATLGAAEARWGKV